MAKENKSMADNLPGNEQLGVKPPFGSGGSGDDAPPNPDKSAGLYEGQVSTGDDFGGQPVHGYKRITVGPSLNPAIVPARGSDLSHENPASCMHDYYEADQLSYLGHFANPEVLEEGHNTNWIAGAIRHPGALHRALHVPAGEKIPAKKLAAASHSSNPTMRRRANLAKTLKGMHK